MRGFRSALTFVVAIAFIGALTAEPAGAAPITMPLPTQTGTFPGNVRGYWFTAPTDFDIVGLYVPTDASTGSMDIEVLRFNSQPPIFAGSTNDFTSLFRTIDNTSADFIPVSIQVAAGDIIGILGYRGNLNSYGVAPFVTDIFGLPVTLDRLGSQFTLDSGPAHDVWREEGNNLSRVQMQYDVSTLNTVPEPATLTLLGLGLAGMGARRWRQRKR